MPRKFAQARSCRGTAKIKTSDPMPQKSSARRVVVPTMTASRFFGIGTSLPWICCCSTSCCRGKNARNNIMLDLCVSSCSYSFSAVRLWTHMTMKHVHWTPTCTIPSRPAPHSAAEICLQHFMSCWLVGSTTMLVIPAMLERVPSMTHHGERPADVPLLMILVC